MYKEGKSIPKSSLLDKISQYFKVSKEKLLPNGMGKTAKNSPNTLTLWLDEQGIWGKNAHKKIIPDSVFTLPKEQLSLFINRLFSTDGWATLLARVIALLTLLVFIALGIHIFMGGASEVRTIGAMTLRLTIWSVIAFVTYIIIKKHRPATL